MTKLKSIVLLQVLALGGITSALAQEPGDLFWYQHIGRSRGTANFANNGTGLKVGSGWIFAQVFAANDGVLYGLTPTGDLYWFRHQGRSDGAAAWANGGNPIRVGIGWNTFTQVFAANDGVVYGISSTGELYWFRHQGRSDGAVAWANAGNGINLGGGWNYFTHVFAADDDVIYALTSSGDLYWYQHLGRSDGRAVWAGGSGTKVGSGWNSFTQVFAADDDVVYGVTSGGDLYWYQHLGRSDGSAVWANSGSGIKVGFGWTYSHILAANDGAVYGIY